MSERSPNDYILTTAQARQRICVGCSTDIQEPAVRQLAYRKKVKAQKRLGTLFFSESSIMSYIRKSIRTIS